MSEIAWDLVQEYENIAISSSLYMKLKTSKISAIKKLMFIYLMLELHYPGFYIADPCSNINGK